MHRYIDIEISHRHAELAYSGYPHTPIVFLSHRLVAVLGVVEQNFREASLSAGIDYV